MTAYVYRHYDAWGRLLYIGFSMDVEARSIKHFQCSSWGDVIGRIDIARFRTRQEALAAERHAIADEAPLFNRSNMRFVRVSVPVMSARKLKKDRPVKVAKRVRAMPSPPEPPPEEKEQEVSSELQHAMRRICNVVEFAKRHKLPLRTLWRVRAGARVRAGTLMLVNAALDKEAAQ